MKPIVGSPSPLQTGARVAFFMAACVVMLAAAGPLTRSVPVQWTSTAVGLLTSITALAMTALFVRWDRIELSDIGIAVESGSWARLAIGFAIGLALAGLQAAAAAATSGAHWVRTSDVKFGSIGMALLAYAGLQGRTGVWGLSPATPGSLLWRRRCSIDDRAAVRP